MRAALPRKSARVEKGLFFRCCDPTERMVSMREAGEAADDVGMFLGIAQVFRIVAALKQQDAANLVFQFFGVHERQVEELQKRRLNALVDAASERAGSDLAGQCVA